MPGEDENTQARKRSIARYLNLTAALAWRDISIKVRKRFPTIDHVVRAGLMTPEEHQIFNGSATNCRWFLPLNWIQVLCEVPEISCIRSSTYCEYISLGHPKRVQWKLYVKKLPKLSTRVFMDTIKSSQNLLAWLNMVVIVPKVYTEASVTPLPPHTCSWTFGYLYTFLCGKPSKSSCVICVIPILPEREACRLRPSFSARVLQGT